MRDEAGLAGRRGSAPALIEPAACWHVRIPLGPLPRLPGGARFFARPAALFPAARRRGARRPSLVNRRCGGAPCCRTAPAGRLGLRRIQVPLATGPNGKRPGCLRSAGYIRRPTALGCPGRGRRRPGLQATREWVRQPLRRGVPAFLKSHFKSQVIKSSLRYLRVCLAAALGPAGCWRAAGRSHQSF